LLPIRHPLSESCRHASEKRGLNFCDWWTVNSLLGLIGAPVTAYVFRRTFFVVVMRPPALVAAKAHSGSLFASWKGRTANFTGLKCCPARDHLGRVINQRGLRILGTQMQ
jgi:hypothetical protein